MHGTFPAITNAAHEAALAVEVAVPRGAKTDYGLLGAQYKANAGAQDLHVAVQYLSEGSERSEPYPLALIGKSEHAFVGLTKQYALSVLSGVGQAYKHGARFSNGTLTFACAANGIVGSNAATFRALGSAVAQLIWGFPFPAEEVNQQLTRLVVDMLLTRSRERRARF
jgi:hypothetical protein